MKFVMAIFVVGLHVNVFTEEKTGALTESFFNCAVPFFFTASGFLLENKILKNKEPEFLVLKSNMLRNLKIYLLWMLLYLPYSLNQYISDGVVWYKDLVYYLRNLLLIGQTVYSWPLWYMLALVVSVFIIFLLRKKNIDLQRIWVIGLFLMILGQFINLSKNSEISWISTICKAELFIYGTRNGVFEGLALVSTGMLIRKYEDKLSNGIILGCVCFAIGIAGSYYTKSPTGIFQPISGCAIFLITISLSLPNKNIFRKLRADSMIIYLAHMFIVVLLFIDFPKFTGYKLNSKSVYLMIALVFLISWFLAEFINYLKTKSGFTWIKYFLA